MNDYLLASSTILNYYDTFGFNVHNINIWIGEYLFKMFIGNFFGMLQAFKAWIIVTMILAGIIYFVDRIFKLYKV